MSDSVNQKLLALDVGLARVGIAVCDPLGLAAHPLTILERRSRNEDFARLAHLVSQEEPTAILCGLPLNMDGSEGERAKSVRKWAMRLAHALRALGESPMPIIFWDERLSTFAAKEIMAAKTIPGNDDAVAAAVILQSYLDAQQRVNPADFGRIDLPEKSKE